MQTYFGISWHKAKAACVFFLFTIVHLQAQTNLITFTSRSGKAYKEILVVKVTDDGLLYRYNEGVGGGMIKLVDLPDDVLKRFGRDQSQVANREQEKAIASANRELEIAIASGLFRKVDGVIYDLRKRQPDWFSFQDVKLIQKLNSNEVLIDPQPDDVHSREVLHVKNMRVFSDTERFRFRAKLVGTYSYINKRDDDRLVRSYDAGRACGRDDIPERMLKDGLASIEISVPPISAELGAILPDSEADKLSATGTGFFITDDGYLVTNDHVIHNAKKIKIRTRSDTLDAELVKTSRLFDLAVLKVKGSFKALPLDFDRQMHLGDSVFTIGFPNVEIQGAAPKFTDGKVSSLSGVDDDPSQYQISVPIQPGNSGGPLVTERGSVIGIVRAKLNDITALTTSGSVPQNVNYAVKAKYLRDLLETIPGVIPKVKSPSSTTKTNESVSATEDATVIVLVY